MLYEVITVFDQIAADVAVGLCELAEGGDFQLTVQALEGFPADAPATMGTVAVFIDLKGLDSSLRPGARRLRNLCVITSYSIHYTKLYDAQVLRRTGQPGTLGGGAGRT